MASLLQTCDSATSSPSLSSLSSSLLSLLSSPYLLSKLFTRKKNFGITDIKMPVMAGITATNI
jgi:hypothetical protein